MEINDDCFEGALGSPQALMVNPNTGDQFCHDVTPFRPDVKLSDSHTLPWDVLVSGIYQFVSGPSELASWTFSQGTANAEGFTLTTATGSTAAQRLAAFRTIQLLQTGQQYGRGMNPLDLRAAKRFGIGGNRRFMIMADLYNVFNSDWVFSQNNTLGTNYNLTTSQWRRPTNVLTARMFKMGAQIDF